MKFGRRVNASAQVVADRFHVMKQVNDELDPNEQQKTSRRTTQTATRTTRNFSWTDQE